VKALEKAGFDMKKLSIVGRDYHTEERPVGDYTSGDRMKYWGKLGAFWGGLWGLLLGAAFFWVPGVGPLLVAGPFGSMLIGAIEGAAVVGGLSALGAGLASIGVPKDSVVRYETAIRAGKYLLIAHGGESDVALAKQIITSSRPEHVGTFSAPSAPSP
jgi:hypothetical protein